MNERLKLIFDTVYSDNKYTDFLIKTQKIYEFYGYEFNLQPVEEKTKREFRGGTCWINEDYKNSCVTNLEIIEFTLPYPTIISKICETNLENFNVVYCKLIQQYMMYKVHSLKEYINPVFGNLQEPECDIFSKNMHLVPTELNDLMASILLNLKDNIVYIESDRIFFRDFELVRDKFQTLLNGINKYDLTYSTTKSKFGIFLSKKKYLIEVDKCIRVKGIKHFDKNRVFQYGGFINLNI